jgi:hypothetical protein
VFFSLIFWFLCVCLPFLVVCRFYAAPYALVNVRHGSYSQIDEALETINKSCFTKPEPTLWFPNRVHHKLSIVFLYKTDLELLLRVCVEFRKEVNLFL